MPAKKLKVSKRKRDDEENGKKDELILATPNGTEYVFNDDGTYDTPVGEQDKQPEPAAEPEPEPKPKRKRSPSAPNPYRDIIMVKPEQLPQPSADSSYVPCLGFLTEEGLFVEIESEARSAKLKKTKLEEAKLRKAYRLKHLEDPVKAEEIKAKMNSEKAKEKRKEYSKKKSTMRRKRKLAKEKRLLHRMLKENEPEYYQKLTEKVKKALEQECQSESGSQSDENDSSNGQSKAEDDQLSRHSQ